MKNQDKKDKKIFSARVRRDFRYGTNAIVLVAAVLVVFVVANLILESFGTPLTLDLTKEKLYSIGEITDRNLKMLDRDVEVIALYDRVKGESDSSRAEVIKVLDLYGEYDHVKISYKDPDSNPGLIRDKVGETDAASYSEGDYIVKCGDKTRRIAESDMFVYETVSYFYRQKTAIQVEQKLTSAILFVTSDEYPVIYCTTGLGEESRSDFTNLFNRIETLGCDVRDLDITGITEMPEDASILIFLSPKLDLTDLARNMIEQWIVQDGGQIIFCADYDERGVQFTNFNRILKDQFGLSINYDALSDEEKKLPIADSANFFTGQSVSKGPMETQSQVLMALIAPRSVSVYQQDSAVTYIENYSVIETGENAKSTNVLDTSTKTGVHTVVGAATNTKYLKQIRGAVFGFTSGLNDTYYKQYGLLVHNAISTFGKTVQWMLGDYAENEGNMIQAKTYDATMIVMDKGQSNMLAIVSMLVVPVLLIGCGVVVWLRRRHL